MTPHDIGAQEEAPKFGQLSILCFPKVSGPILGNPIIRITIRVLDLILDYLLVGNFNNTCIDTVARKIFSNFAGQAARIPVCQE